LTGVGSRHRPRRDWKPAAASVHSPRMSLVLQSLLRCPDSCQGTSPHQQGRDTKMAEHFFCGNNPALKAFHNRLTRGNKKPKVIIVAVMRKMITTLNAKLRDNASWQPKSA
jgi:hypothetical protein